MSTTTFIPPVLGEVRGPLRSTYGRETRTYFYVRSRDGWVPVHQMPRETDADTRQRAVKYAAELKGGK